MFHGMRGEWDMAFARSGQDALQLMSRQPFDVIVTDVRMQGIDGVELLNRVKKEYPPHGAIRLLERIRSRRHFPIDRRHAPVSVETYD